MNTQHPAPRGSRAARLRSNLLLTVPPFATNTPPAGAAALLGWLEANGCTDFDFLDLQLWWPELPLSYAMAGAFGESFVRDVADLPLVLRLLRAHDEGRPLAPQRDAAFDAYCFERAIHPGRLAAALGGYERFARELSQQIEPLDFVGFTVWSSNLLTTLMTAAVLKRRPNPPIIVAGGPQVTESAASARLGLASGLFDVVALGEGEQTLLELHRAFLEGRPLRGIPGTMWREPDGRFASLSRPLLKMASLPLPAFGKTLLPAYQTHGMRVVAHQLSRGCIGTCSFCSEWGFWQRFRPDGAEHALDQAEELVRRFGAEHLQFTDSLLNGHFGRLMQFAEGILERQVEASWSGFLRADMDPDSARLLARSGFRMAFCGVESLDDRTLGLMKKGTSAEKEHAALEALLGAGIQVQAGIIPGFPGDTREAFLATVERLLALRDRFPGLLTLNVEPFVVSPGQPIFGELEAHGLRGERWDEAVLDLAPRYRSITDGLLCKVEGSNQGSERLGQLRIVNALSAAPAALQRPRLEQLVEGWSLFAVPGAGALLVSDDERARLEEVERLEPGALAQTAAELRGRHLAVPEPVAAQPAGFTCELGEQTLLGLSPFVAIREAGQGRLLVFDSASRRASFLPEPVIKPLRLLGAGARSPEELRRGGGLDERAVLSLLEAGVLVVVR